jgi:hypothetical protein
MIYQCYFKKDQESMLFKTDLYSPFGLEPEVNPNIALNCPELESSALRLSLTEYGAFLNIFRNDVSKVDNDWWIGFTSYRQLDKTPIIFKNKQKFEELLHVVARGFGGWGFYVSQSNASNVSELCHPKINNFISHILSRFNIQIPQRFYTERHILFANYWAMHKELFVDFMNWSWPIIQYAMTQSDHEYVHTKSPIPTIDQRKWLGYFMERLFLIWYMQKNLHPANFGPLCGILA